MLLRPTESQIDMLIKHENMYVKCAGVLFIRYTSKPSELWARLKPYLLYDNIFNPSSNPKYCTTFGEYVEKLLIEQNYFNTRLPRIQLLLEREIKKNAMLWREKRKRMFENRLNSELFGLDKPMLVDIVI